MKRIPVLVFLLLLAAGCAAQVYTFKPRYSCQITYSGGDQNDLWFDGVTTTSSTLTVDLDKKTISAPIGSIYSDLKVTPIADVKHDEENDLLILKIKGNKEVGQVWCYYELKLDKNGEPLYIRQTERLTGKRFSSDTFFHLYTSDLRTLTFYRECTRMKQNLALSSSKNVREQEVKALAGVVMEKSANTVEMRNGYVYWTEGKGRKAIKHNLVVDSVSILKDPATKGVLVSCHEGGEVYFIMYMTTNRKWDPSQYSWQRFIIINKHRDGIHKEMTILW